MASVALWAKSKALIMFKIPWCELASHSPFLAVSTVVGKEHELKWVIWWVFSKEAVYRSVGRI